MLTQNTPSPDATGEVSGEDLLGLRRAKADGS